MKIAPLIHSKTFEVDFNSKFAVRPDDFTDADIEWARKKILPSTQDLNILNDVRLVVASQGNRCIAGIACMLDFFAKDLTAGERAKAEEFFCDNRGRYIKVFLGYSIKDAAANEIPIVTPSDLWQMFKDYLAPEWYRKSPESRLVPYRDVKTKSLPPSTFKPAQIFQGVELYEMNSALNEKLFETYLALALKQNLAFCTNLDRIQPIEEQIYHAVTTTPEIIDRLREKQSSLDEASQKKNRLELEFRRRLAAKNSHIDTSQLYAGKRFVFVADFMRRLNRAVADIIVADSDMNFFELGEFEFSGKKFKKFVCEVHKIE